MISYCNTGEPPYDCDTKVLGWRPVYDPINTYKSITTSTPKPTVNAGKIYVYNNYILQVETGEGIHVIDNSNRSNPQKIGFINVKACGEVEMRNGNIYTNNFNDLVTLQYNFSSNSVTELSRIPNTFQNLQNNYRYAVPDSSGYYVCAYKPDSIVVNWVKDSLDCYSCYKP